MMKVIDTSQAIADSSISTHKVLNLPYIIIMTRMRMLYMITTQSNKFITNLFLILF